MFKFSQNLKIIRESKGLTKTQVAKELGISLSAYSFYETGIKEIGDREPSLSNLVKLAKILNVSTDTLLDVDLVLDMDFDDNFEKYKKKWKMHGFSIQKLSDSSVVIIPVGNKFAASLKLESVDKFMELSALMHSICNVFAEIQFQSLANIVIAPPLLRGKMLRSLPEFEAVEKLLSETENVEIKPVE